MTITLKAQIENQVGASSATVALLEANLQAAALRWSEVLAGSANLTVRLTIVESLPGGGANGGPAQVIGAGFSNGGQLTEGLAAHELRGAPDQSAAPEIIINVAMKGYLDSQLWLDPTPLDNGADLPLGKTDGVSVLMHEIGHGLGFTGSLGPNGKATPASISTFDEHVNASGNATYFSGPNSAKIYGGPVPLTTGNIYHVGNNEPAPGANLVPDLMNGVVFVTKRYAISELDIAMIADMGIGTIRSDILAAPQYAAILNAGPGIDTVVFSGTSSAATIKSVGQDVAVTSTPGSAPVTVTVQNVERVRFTDKIIAFDNDGNAGDAYRLYEAAFNRTPDEAGLSYWVRFLDVGHTLGEVAQAFVSSGEFKGVYGASPSSIKLVDTFYRNVLDRPGEASGVAHWIGVLERGISVSEVLSGFSESAENQAAVAPKIAGGISLTLDYFV